MSRYERKYSAVEDAALITIIQAQARYNMGRDKVRGLAEEAHAIRTFKIHPEALEILRSMEKRSIYIFVNSNNVHFHKEDFGKVIRGVRKKMETLTPADRDDKNKQLSLYSILHLLKRSFRSARIENEFVAVLVQFLTENIEKY